jgi:endonuclease/exonuclease/phosphatase family metal-dependent hydrolase
LAPKIQIMAKGGLFSLTGSVALLSLFLFTVSASAAATRFSIATYNLENYLDVAAGARAPKSSQSRAKIRESLRALGADVLGLQEIGSSNALQELRASLNSEGLDYPFWEFVTGSDPDINIAVLSRFPIAERRSHTRDTFLLGGRRFRTSRGFAEVDIQVTDRYRFTLFVAHLKSRRPVAQADEADLREQEALLLREKLQTRLQARPSLNLVLVGDLNDVRDSGSTRALLGKGRLALLDTRPAERNGDANASSTPGLVPRNITWTYFYGKEDTYSRIDYIMVSRGMAKELDPSGTYVLALPNWGLASDHRPVIARFVAEDK